MDLEVRPGSIRARVAGSSRRAAYRVELTAACLDAGPQATLLRLLHGRNPADLPRALEPEALQAGAALFPRSLGFECACADWAYPCKHAAAVALEFARALDRDASPLFVFRGVDPGALRALWAARAAGADRATAPAAMRRRVPLRPEPRGTWRLLRNRDAWGDPAALLVAVDCAPAIAPGHGTTEPAARADLPMRLTPPPWRPGVEKPLREVMAVVCMALAAVGDPEIAERLILPSDLHLGFTAEELAALAPDTGSGTVVQTDEPTAAQKDAHATARVLRAACAVPISPSGSHGGAAPAGAEHAVAAGPGAVPSERPPEAREHAHGSAGPRASDAAGGAQPVGPPASPGGSPSPQPAPAALGPAAAATARRGPTGAPPLAGGARAGAGEVRGASGTSPTAGATRRPGGAEPTARTVAGDVRGAGGTGAPTAHAGASVTADGRGPGGVGRAGAPPERAARGDAGNARGTGGATPAGRAPQARSGAPQASGFCASCGAPAKPAWRYCSHCGRPLPAADRPAARNATVPRAPARGRG